MPRADRPRHGFRFPIGSCRDLVRHSGWYYQRSMCAGNAVAAEDESDGSAGGDCGLSCAWPARLLRSFDPSNADIRMMKNKPLGADMVAGVEQKESPRKLTRAEEVHQRLADDIVDGKLFPDMSLDETEIAASYGAEQRKVHAVLVCYGTNPGVIACSDTVGLAGHSSSSRSAFLSRCRRSSAPGPERPCQRHRLTCSFFDSSYPMLFVFPV